VLVLLLGQSRLRDLNLVGGSALIEGLRASGYPTNRIDYLLNTHAGRNHVVIDGKRRARRYQLTPAGTAKAEQIARRLIDMSPEPQQS